MPGGLKLARGRVAHEVVDCYLLELGLDRVRRAPVDRDEASLDPLTDGALWRRAVKAEHGISA